jgi:hypothetical protein
MSGNYSGPLHCKRKENYRMKSLSFWRLFLAIALINAAFRLVFSAESIYYWYGTVVAILVGIAGVTWKHWKPKTGDDDSSRH